jgi:tetratricopeptide (TPR) repeat protein
MRLLRGIALALVLAVALRPEFPRYRSERVLRGLSSVLRQVLTRPDEIPDASAALGRIARFAQSAARGLPGDPRPGILAGSAFLVAGEPTAALESYRTALAEGERAETDLNMARAFEALGEKEKADAAYLRAVWISPALLPLLLPDVAAPLSAEVARLEAQLKAGKLRAPPPLPE